MITDNSIILIYTYIYAYIYEGERAGERKRARERERVGRKGKREIDIASWTEKERSIWRNKNSNREIEKDKQRD